ncbi:unnamed protein product, partial [Bubo scandiacus]
LFVSIKQLTCQILHDIGTELLRAEMVLLNRTRGYLSVMLGTAFIIEESDICGLNDIVFIIDLYHTTSI